ncbi:Retrovirus-related Pol polyprotein from transposon RE1 [Araneus ventricosus]|uniref:Retrovirus-related Pol polyprotein from transposon RE1 n=1 Tax=Araneus ventricosus TaxID=182803 RepID=A0A4Y2DET9_ARAVE|nr:Retrovirus-related Pol polyprotein from transposon RE1 [Araneus ventricosus]
MKDRKVWELQELSDKCKVLGCRWVFSSKRDDKNKIKRFKAGLVAQGFKQRKGESFDEVYSLVVSFGIIRCDVKCDYLYAPLKEQIFVKQPPGFEKNPNLVCRLQKVLYGLYQSGRACHTEQNRTPLHAPETMTFWLFKQCGGHEVEEPSEDAP